MHATLNVKHASERPSPADGMRVLVERRWPPGLTRERVAADLWLKDAGPSDALRRWCAKDPRRWETFKSKYRAELEPRADLLRLLEELRRRGPVTLLHGLRDTSRNSAQVLREMLEERRGNGRKGEDN
jgi:uncharacterized protein YeaO (DUF488 family)